MFKVHYRFAILSALLISGLFFTIAVARANSVPSVGETCFATPNDGATVYSSTTAQAVRDAVGAAPAEGSVKVAGYCPGVQMQSGTIQTVLITQTLTLGGGYTLTNWTTPYPLTQPATLDALGGGRVLLANAALTLTDVIIQQGTYTDAAGALFNGPATLSGTTFLSNTVINHGGGAQFNGPVTLTASAFISNTAGNNAGGVWFNNNNYLTTLTNITFSNNVANGVGGGAVINTGATAVTLTNVTFTNNRTTTGNAGGVWSNSPTLLSSTTFISNTAGNNGGGAYFLNTVTLTNTTFTDNTADAGGGAYFASSTLVVTLAHSSFTNNRATTADGGGGHFGGPALLTNTTFTSNTAYTSGGGTWFGSAATLTATTFISNTAVDGGGGYFNNVVTLNNPTFTGNQVTNNGGGAYFNTTTTLASPTFSTNLAASGGGAWFNATASLTNARFISNTATSGGGGAVFLGLSTLISPTFTNNTATNNGGGAYFTGGNLKELTNALFNRNQAAGQGAAIYVANANPLNVQHVTIVSPTVLSGTAVYVAAGTVNITNTLIASHTVGLARAGGTANEDYNLFANIATPYSGTILQGGNSLTGTAGFYNSTAYTLTPDSTALDHGINLGITSDYFGNPRPQGLASDIGYAESPYTYTLLYTLTAQPAHMFANGIDEALLTFTATNALGSGAPFYGRAITFTGNSLGSLAATNFTLNANGVATTTYSVGLLTGTAPLTGTMFDWGNFSVATDVVTLKPNPLIGTLAAQFGGQTITYTFVVTNVDMMPQTVVMSGSVPTGASAIAVTGGISVPTGGDYGFGYAEASNIDLDPNESYTLQWTIQFIGFTGDVFTQGHAESLQARLRLPATLRVYRQLLMPVYKP